MNVVQNKLIKYRCAYPLIEIFSKLLYEVKGEIIDCINILFQPKFGQNYINVRHYYDTYSFLEITFRLMKYYKFI